MIGRRERGVRRRRRVAAPPFMIAAAVLGIVGLALALVVFSTIVGERG